MPQLLFDQLYHQIMSFPNLNPSPRVNQAFSQLVSLALNPQNQDLIKTISPSNLHLLHQRCSDSEYQLELHWANQVLASPHPWQVLTQFPYWQNYLKLTALEYDLAVAHNTTLSQTNQPFLFVGSGPIPFTAIILAKTHHHRVICLDSDPIAVSLSSQLITKLQLNHRLTIHHQSGQDYTQYQASPLIWVAALAGLEPQAKQTIFQVIKDQITSNTHILTRSSHGSRQLLYQPLPTQIQRQFQTIAAHHPQDDIINSILLLKPLPVL